MFLKLDYMGVVFMDTQDDSSELRHLRVVKPLFEVGVGMAEFHGWRVFGRLSLVMISMVGGLAPIQKGNSIGKVCFGVPEIFADDIVLVKTENSKSSCHSFSLIFCSKYSIFAFTLSRCTSIPIFSVIVCQI